MATHLLIDGYNFLKRTGLASLFDPSDLEGGRRSVLDALSAYKKERAVRITVVFDAMGGPSLARQKEGYRGIEVIYSKRGETADQVMVETIGASRAGLLVVTSDRAIIDEAKRHGVPFITPSRLEAAMGGAVPEESDAGRAARKGNPHKAPKGLRRARKTIRKL
jgi:hypothetical protein